MPNTRPYQRRGSADEKNYVDRRDELVVLIGGEVAGTLSVFRGGYYRFAYDAAYTGPELSVRMPMAGTGGTYPHDVVLPWFEGLLPDNEHVREDMARRAGCRANDCFGLLAHFGKDCPGAIQLCHEEELASLLERAGAYEPIATERIGRRLSAITERSQAWADYGEHWSLGGAQDKLALAYQGGFWNTCIGSAATTHLVKPGVATWSLQALDEYLCMRLAAACGLPVAAVEYVRFGDVWALVIERYDREAQPDGTVLRIHQEDFCQALGYHPDDKYHPDAGEVLALLADVTGGTESQAVQDFVAALFLNYLIGATDAHAKNYSLIHLDQGLITLAPLYDVASMLPYRPGERARVRKTAMSIGGEKVIGHLAGSNIRRFAETHGLSPDGCLQLMEELAYRVRDAVGTVVRESATLAGVETIGPDLERCVRANCEAMLKNLPRDGRTLDRSRDSEIRSGSLRHGEEVS